MFAQTMGSMLRAWQTPENLPHQSSACGDAGRMSGKSSHFPSLQSVSRVAISAALQMPYHFACGAHVISVHMQRTCLAREGRGILSGPHPRCKCQTVFAGLLKRCLALENNEYKTGCAPGWWGNFLVPSTGFEASSQLLNYHWNASILDNICTHGCFDI